MRQSDRREERREVDASMRSHSSSSMFRMLQPFPGMPSHADQNIDPAPRRPTAISIISWTAVGSNTQATWCETEMPPPERSRAVCATPSSARSTARRDAPSRTKACAMARPMPLAAPVTMALLPSSTPIAQVVSRMAAAVFSPIMMVVRLVLALTTQGMIEASATERPSTPITRH